MSKNFNTMGDALALAAAAATANADKMATRKLGAKKPAELVQLNVRIDVTAHRRLKAFAVAHDTTVKDLLERFIEQLPDVQREVDVPAAVKWLRK